MHLFILSLLVALVVCLLLLGVFALFTITPLGRRQQGPHERMPRLH